MTDESKKRINLKTIIRSELEEARSKLTQTQLDCQSEVAKTNRACEEKIAEADYKIDSGWFLTQNPHI